MVAAVAVSGVHKRFGSVQALKGIDLVIERGEFFGLLGPNGAGKSTLISIIAGLCRASAGHVAVLDHDVETDYRKARQCLGVVPQELVFDPFFTVREILRIQSGYFGLGRENYAWIDELIEALMLSDKADANLRTLSGGMKRRVLIAQALVHRPQVVVLDEPTAGVDVGLRQSLWQFIQRLHREGHTIVLTTHYLEEAEMLCGRIAILDQGRIVALDTKDDLLARGMAQATLRLITARPVTTFPPAVAGKVRKIEGNHVELQLNRHTDSVIAVLDALRLGGAEVLDLRIQEPDLEDVFMELTRKDRQ